MEDKNKKKVFLGFQNVHEESTTDINTPNSTPVTHTTASSSYTRNSSSYFSFSKSSYNISRNTDTTPSLCKSKFDPEYISRISSRNSKISPRSDYFNSPNSGKDYYANQYEIEEFYRESLAARNRQKISSTSTSDRFIPSRQSSNYAFSTINSSCIDDRNIETRNDMSASETSASNPDVSMQQAVDGRANSSSSSSSSVFHYNCENQPTQQILNNLFRSEIFQQPYHQHTLIHNQRTNNLTTNTNYERILRYSQATNINHSILKPFIISPQKLHDSNNTFCFTTCKKRKRRVSKIPFKVLDAPSLQDDFYLNLVDWSCQNVLAVGLASCVYLWSACTSKVTKLCDFSGNNSSNDADNDDNGNLVTSVAWSKRGINLAVGTNKGEVQIWDTLYCKKIRTFIGHSARTGTLSWNQGSLLVSGSRDRLIYLRDVKCPDPHVARLSAHKQEVCGLKWSFDEQPSQQLASGGNDNKLLIWDIKHTARALYKFTDHTAAVKAIAWSPHQHGLLASGGGTADRCIRFWNTLSGTSVACMDTGSQVCNLAWSKNCNEIVSTHGYSLNQIVVWQYPNMGKLATLTGHTYRVLYLAVSPDGSTIVTGAGDETLRFWQVFPSTRSHDRSNPNGILFPSIAGTVIR